MEGIILFNKPKGKTSAEITNYFKKLTKKKIGHGGTLDRLAEGLLIIGIGEGTKELTKFLKESSKTYIAEIVLGAVSDTYDADGKIVKTGKPISEISEIEKILKSFVGEIEQTPPPYSAIKIKGKRASDLMREGKSVELKARKVKIHNIHFLGFKENILKIETEVSSGTYIRSLVHDLGEKLGCGAYLNNLIRTKINEYTLEEALTFEDLEKDYIEFIAKIYGRVQGVGFRFFTEAWANKLKIFGYAQNLTDGTVKVLAQGKEKDLQVFIENLKQGPRLAKVEKIDIIFRKPLKYFYDFRIY